VTRPEPVAPAAIEQPPAAVGSGYFYWVTKVVLTPVLTIAFRPRIEGVRNVPRRGPAILACNHVSYLDWLFLPLVVRWRHISFLAKLEYFTRPGLRGRLQRFFFTNTGQVPVDRSGSDASSAALRTAARLLREGKLVGIFPEGSRSRDGRLNRGRTGLARIAAETGVPVVPCATVGAYELCPPGAKVPRPRKVAVRFGEPMTFPGSPCTPSAGELRTWTDELMARIQQLSGQEQSGVDAVGSRS
jgi:1-acyl-sn-glycerol-3-phosphate acyltransferase